MKQLSNWQWFVRCLTHRHKWGATQLDPNAANGFIRYCQDKLCTDVLDYQTRRWRDGPWEDKS